MENLCDIAADWSPGENESNPFVTARTYVKNSAIQKAYT